MVIRVHASGLGLVCVLQLEAADSESAFHCQWYAPSHTTPAAAARRPPAIAEDALATMTPPSTVSDTSRRRDEIALPFPKVGIVRVPLAVDVAHPGLTSGRLDPFGSGAGESRDDTTIFASRATMATKATTMPPVNSHLPESIDAADDDEESTVTSELPPALLVVAPPVLTSLVVIAFAPVAAP